MNKLIIAALLFVPMSAYAGGFPDPFEASNAAVSIKAADREQDAEVNKSLAQAQTDANGALSSALSSSAKGDATTLNTANVNAQGYANTAQSNAEGYSTTGDKVTLASANQTSASGDASTLVSANQAAATGDKTTLAQANQFSTAGDKTTLASANTDAQAMANAAQNNSESYASTTAQTDANAAQNSAETQAQSYVSTLAKSDAQSFITKQLQVNGSSTVTGNSTVGGNETVGGTLTANGANMDNNVIQNVAAGTTGTDAANVSQVNNMGASTLQSANNYTNAQIAGAENFAQGAANQAQINSEQYAASGIAAALAMPPAPFLPVGHAYIGVQEGTYDGQFATGIRGTYQITSSLDANVGVSGGSGLYGHVAVTAGMGYEFGG